VESGRTISIFDRQIMRACGLFHKRFRIFFISTSGAKALSFLENLVTA